MIVQFLTFHDVQELVLWMVEKNDVLIESENINVMLAQKNTTCVIGVRTKIYGMMLIPKL